MSRRQPARTGTVTDKRRIDPETGEVRQVPPGTGPGRGGAGAAPAATRQGDKVAELTADLQRVKAEYANYRKRALREQQPAADRAKAAVVSQLLGVLDDLDRARSHGDLESGPLKSVADKLIAALTGLGLTAFGEEGDDFDPVLHEAVQHEGDGARLNRSSAPSCGSGYGSVTRCCAMRWSASSTRSRDDGEARAPTRSRSTTSTTEGEQAARITPNRR